MGPPVRRYCSTSPAIGNARPISSVAPCRSCHTDRWMATIRRRARLAPLEAKIRCTRIARCVRACVQRGNCAPTRPPWRRLTAPPGTPALQAAPWGCRASSAATATPLICLASANAPARAQASTHQRAVSSSLRVRPAPSPQLKGWVDANRANLVSSRIARALLPVSVAPWARFAQPVQPHPCLAQLGCLQIAPTLLARLSARPLRQDISPPLAARSPRFARLARSQATEAAVLAIRVHPEALPTHLECRTASCAAVGTHALLMLSFRVPLAHSLAAEVAPLAIVVSPGRTQAPPAAPLALFVRRATTAQASTKFDVRRTPTTQTPPPR